MPINNYLYGTIIGDALGTSLHNLSKGNIKSTYKNITDFTDPIKAIKANLTKWRKPGLYSIISQLSILSAMLSSMRRHDKNSIQSYLGEADISENSDFGIFRHPNLNQRNILGNLYNNVHEKATTNTASAFMLPVTGSMLIAAPDAEKVSFKDLFEFISYFTDNPYNIAGSIIYAGLILQITLKPDNYNKQNLFRNIIEICNEKLLECQNNSPLIFDSGMNPDNIFNSFKTYNEIFKNFSRISSYDECEKILVDELSKLTSSSITRATIDHPLSLLALSTWIVSENTDNPENVLFKSVELGGATQSLCSIVGGLSNLLTQGKSIPANLKNNLVNKKKVAEIIDTIASQKSSKQKIIDFFNAESALTDKELEEKNAKLKHFKPPVKKKKKSKHRQNKENLLNKHIVESWTKLDKAKWKKDKKRSIKHHDDDFETEDNE